MLSKVFCGSTYGIDAYIVAVETHIENQMPAFLVVGLPDNAVRESRERVTAAIKNSGCPFPVKRIIVNLAPADVRKEGSAFDLPIAIGILRAIELIADDALSRYIFIGELALDGTLRPVHGVLPIAIEARNQGYEAIVVPRENAREAAMVQGIDVFPCISLAEAIDLLNGTHPHPRPEKVDLHEVFHEGQLHCPFDFSDVKGQENVKRALEVAAAGAHNVIMIGPPGSGKTMLAKRIPTILPPLTFDEALETTKIHSIAGLLSGGTALITQRPFRSPHHTISDAALVGGGVGVARPGEISAAHNGVLFLDELPEFARNVLEVLRQPLEDAKVTIARSKMTIDYPANFMLVAAMNPCPCGNYGGAMKACTCTPVEVQRYMTKISGPLLDRIDIHVECPQVRYQELSDRRIGERSASIRDRVIAARERQLNQFTDRPGLYANASMQSRDIRRYCAIDDECQELLKMAINKLGLSARAYDRILKVGRTIADLAGSDRIRPDHLSEAIQYRSLDRQMWGG